MKFPAGTRVIGDWGAMSPDDRGEIVDYDDTKGYRIKWDDSPNGLTEDWHQVKWSQPTEGSPICVYVDPMDPRVPVLVEAEGEGFTVLYNEFGSMFSLEDDRYDISAWLCSRKLKPLDHNQCWLLKEWLPLLAKRGVVSAVMDGPNKVMEETDEGEAVLCNITHPRFHDEGYSPFGDYCRSRLGQQCQYGSRYIDGRLEGYPALGEGLRFKNLGNGDYHSIRIHRDDMDEFERRYRAYQERLTG